MKRIGLWGCKMDSIFIKDIVVFAHHGVFKEEKTLGQKFLIDLKLKMNLQPSAILKDLKKTVHYGILSNDILQIFKEKSNDLIETCAEEIAIFVLKNYKVVKEVTVCVKKPWAPVNLPLDNVLVEITRKRHRVFLALGSNVGDSYKFLKDAKEMIKSEYTTINKESKIYKTKPWGFVMQDDFLNQVIEIETFFESFSLLKEIQKIENKLARERKIHWGPRTIDIDILFFDDEKIYTDDLIIPHPYIEKRAFVLKPLKEIAPFFIHPVLNRSISDLFEMLDKEK